MGSNRRRERAQRDACKCCRSSEVEDLSRSHRLFSHGGRCLFGQQDVWGNDQFFCDCSSAVEVPEEDGQMGIIKYAGRFCEQKVQEEHMCGSMTVYCLNGGSCNAGADSDINPCVCPPTHTGESCQYPIGQVPECDLECGDHGSCRLGIKDLSFFDEELGVKPHEEYMYCVCKTGFVGTRCEAPVQVCPGDGHVCLNGGMLQCDIEPSPYPG